MVLVLVTKSVMPVVAGRCRLLVAVSVFHLGFSMIASVNPAAVIDCSTLDVVRVSVFTNSGVQAMIALAYGIETISRADKTANPSNIVAMAKIEDSRGLSIDHIFDAIEAVVIADENAVKKLKAADLLPPAL